MSNWKDKMKDEAKGNDYPKLDILIRLQPKTIDNRQSLVYFASEQGKDEVLQKEVPQIEGILVGSYMIFTAFSQAENKSYKTTPFFDKTNQVRIFTTKKGDKVDFTGTALEAQDWIFTKAKSTVKMHLVLVLLREKGFVTIETNMSIGIVSMNKVKEARTEYLISVSAKLYEPSDFIHDKLPENFKKMADKNKPTYANLTITRKEIDENISTSYKINEQYDKFLAYKKFVTSGNASKVSDSEEKDVLENEQIPKDDYNFKSAPGESVKDDDLPF
jgi:hypothetical protein